jgi:hypothetical protein
VQQITAKVPAICSETRTSFPLSWRPCRSGGGCLLSPTRDLTARSPVLLVWVLLVWVGASTVRIAHVPGPADAAAVDVQFHSGFLSPHERRSQRIALAPVGRLREAVGAPMLSEAGFPVGLSWLRDLRLPRVVSTRHPTILVAPWAGQVKIAVLTPRPRRALNPTEGDRGSDPARRDTLNSIEDRSGLGEILDDRAPARVVQGTPRDAYGLQRPSPLLGDTQAQLLSPGEGSATICPWPRP